MDTDLDASKYWTGRGGRGIPTDENHENHGERGPKPSWWVHRLVTYELLLESVAVKGKMYSPAKHWIFFGRLFAGIVVIHHVNSDCWCLINPQSAPTTVGGASLRGLDPHDVCIFRGSKRCTTHIPAGKPCGDGFLCDGSGWWFGTSILFSHINWEFHHPNWLSYFSEGWPNHQPGVFIFEQDIQLKDPQFCASRKVWSSLLT